MPDCLTCAKPGDGNDQPLAVDARKDIQNALCKHFWFAEEQYLHSYICHPCWQKIEDFHRFYCEVRELHFPKQEKLLELLQGFELNPPEQMDECGVAEDHATDAETGLIKCEDLQIEVVSDDSSAQLVEVMEAQDNKEPAGKDKSKEQRANVRRKSRGPLRRVRLGSEDLNAVQEWVSQNLTLECDTCSQQCPTFDGLQRHSMMEHAKKAFVLCCCLKFSDSYRFVDHIRFHMDPNQFKCPRCSRQFGNRGLLGRHTRACGTKSSNQQKAADRSSLVETENVDNGTSSDAVTNTEDKHNDMKYEIVDEEQSDGEEDSEQEIYYSKKSSVTQHEKVDFDPIRSKLKRLTKLTTEEKIEIQKYVSTNVKLACDTCSERFTSFYELQKHSLMQHQKRSLIICCKRKFLVSYKFNDHIRYHLNPERFKCFECSKIYPDRSALNRHTQFVHSKASKKVYTCQVCQCTFLTEQNLTIHATIHEETVPDDSDTASTTCSNISKRDGDEIIAKNITLECDTCKEKFDTFLALQRHSMAAHEKQASVYCCGLKFVQKNRLLSHITRHLDQSKFQCKLCDKVMSDLPNLKNHMETHLVPEEAKTFECPHCPKMFVNQTTLNCHVRRHNSTTAVVNV
ncbi:zinc finger protein 91 [Aedes aegypti]|uniref:C2H2-type domain-containing protein n=1 Tax=Aedes aegypti TaxID=7159 RepID=A0A6I8U128_AEDAE|nr:zinc finger protein 91 [Aedes aegypti]